MFRDTKTHYLQLFQFYDLFECYGKIDKWTYLKAVCFHPIYLKSIKDDHPISRIRYRLVLTLNMKLNVM
jgi:hypothetical protein